MVLLAKEIKLLLKNEVHVCIFIYDFFKRHTGLDSIPYQVRNETFFSELFYKLILFS